MKAKQTRRKRGTVCVRGLMAETLSVMRRGGKIVLEYGGFWLCAPPSVPHTGAVKEKTVNALVARGLIKNAFGYRISGGWSQHFTLTPLGKEAVLA